MGSMLLIEKVENSVEREGAEFRKSFSPEKNERGAPFRQTYDTKYLGKLILLRLFARYLRSQE
jgi:hypothetical protein